MALLVADNQHIINTIRDALHQEHFSIYHAENGEQALRFIQRNTSEIVLIDCVVGEIQKFRDNIKNITEKNEAIRVLRESENKLSSVIEGINDGVVVADNDLRITHINRAAESILAVSKEHVLDRHLFEIFPKTMNIEQKEKCIQFIKGKIPFSFETSLETSRFKNWFDVDIYPLNSGTSVYLRNITKYKTLEAKFQQSQRLETIGKLTGGIAHDFNNLLTIIQGYSDLIMQEVTLPKDVQANLQEIKNATKKASSLTQQLLAFSRKQILKPVELNLNTLIKDMEKLLQRLIGEDIALVIRLLDDLGIVKVDPVQMEQIVFNLAVNAREAMPLGGRLTIETAHHSVDQKYTSQDPIMRSGSYVMLAVSDTGKGMDKDTMDHIFEPFFTTKEKGKGTGLGLSTVYGIVKQSCGYIWVYSELGKGTTFKIYLPLHHCKKETEKVAVEPSAPIEGSETILVVEDDDALRQITSMTLSSMGYTVLEASDGVQAIQLFARKPVDLVIVDIVMPRMSGRDLATYLLERTPETRILYISGYTDDAIIRHGISTDDVFFLQKPYSTLSLTQKVREVLDHKMSPSQ